MPTPGRRARARQTHTLPARWWRRPVRLIEVSHSSRRKDLGVKAAIYAAAGAPEYWVVDLDRKVVVRHLEPGADGYATVTTHHPGEVLDAAGVPVVLDDLFAEDD